MRSIKQWLGVAAFLLTGAVILGCDEKREPPAAQSSSTPQASAPNGEVWPTEEEAKAAIYKVEAPLWGPGETNTSVYHIKAMRHEVKSVKFAQRTTQKQMNFGANAITVYPAKILYTRITEYTSKEPERTECGADGVWFFYKDSFGDWTGKYGSE